MSITDKDYEEMLSGVVSGLDFQTFLSSLDRDPVKGACFDSERISFADIKAEIPEASETEDDGYFEYPYGTVTGNKPLYAAGAIYPMDHSAYKVAKHLAMLLKGKEQARILDMCAAPGGKSIALCSLLTPALLVANDLSAKRAGILKTNMERAGLLAVVTNSDPKDFAVDFQGYFDAVILDAPCSGSGMSRKKEKMADDWTKDKVLACVPIQRALLDAAYGLLRKGGILSYSTCSYSRQEDEDQISDFLKRHKDCKAMRPCKDGCVAGIDNLGERYLPGLFDGEGQYSCFIVKLGRSPVNEPIASLPVKAAEFAFPSFSLNGNDWVNPGFDARLARHGVIRAGYALLDKEQYAKCPYDWDLCHCPSLPFKRLELTLDQVLKFIRGEDIRMDTKGYDGIIAIATFKGFPLAFCRGVRGRLRNFLPKGLRVKD